MATPERPPSRINGKSNPAYTAWRRRQAAKPTVSIVQPVAAPVADAETLTLRVVKLARNARFVYCDLEGIKVPVKVAKNLQQRLLKKKIQVRKEGETYVHIR